MYKKQWKNIAFLMFVSMFLTMCFSFSQPTSYVSTVTLLSTSGRQLTSGSLGKFLGLSVSSSTDIIVSLLNSRHMAKDISDKFNLDKKPRFRYKIETSETRGTFVIKVRGKEPILVQKIANFVVENLDKLNMKLDITPNKPMVKVLDPALRGIRQSRQTPRKILVAGLLSFLLITLYYAFFLDYLKRTKIPIKR